ncbi:MAG: hypothetical protein R3C45_00630 [Phycisphaerales bacterium]
MIERESRLALLIGAVIAVLLHAALVPVWGLGLSGVTVPRNTLPPKEDRPLPAPHEAEVGRAHASVTNIAWIAYDDFQELLAEHSTIEQPALQKQEDPTPDAPIELDPTPPAPNANPALQPEPVGERPVEDVATPVPISPVGPVPLPSPQPDGQLPYAPARPDAARVCRRSPGCDQPAEATHQSPAREQPDAPGAPDASAKPTAAPRDAAEAPPVTIIPGIVKVRPGKVLTADGIEIKTVVPRPSVIAIYSTVPRNPEATLWFDASGKVTRVELTRSTGADNWDDPVRTALEQWTATGERIENLEGELQLTVELLLRGTP